MFGYEVLKTSNRPEAPTTEASAETPKKPKPPKPPKAKKHANAVDATWQSVTPKQAEQAEVKIQQLLLEMKDGR